ncbi:hypothetical protein KC726_05575 [Candidatus Woesebacteria bacterium]|nr:hypothetical protein [Candidatus Woesebacteria bacterium]
MKVFRIVFSILIIVSTYFFVSNSKNNPQPNDKEDKIVKEVVKAIDPISKLQSSVFVPYWIVGRIDQNSFDGYTRLYYFGITVNDDGIDKADQGYISLPSFSQKTQGKVTILTLRLLDDETNDRILTSETYRSTIMNEVADAAQQYGFSGVAIDLETNVLTIEDQSDIITSFYQKSCKELADRNLSCTPVIYGDTIYRKRPYNLKAISKISERVIIMAYDFHKSRGEPGPNFPLHGKEKYGYDFETMANDMTTLIEPSKLTIAFGMFGYDWTLGKQGLPLKQATARTLNDINTMFYPCDYEKCTIARDTLSAETYITYQDPEGYVHDVWFEDQDSEAKKVDLLKQQGVGDIVYWAFGYY